jgi:hypothetical protein
VPGCSLTRPSASAVAVFTQHQALHAIVEVGHPGGRQIGLADLLGYQRRLRVAYRLEDRAHALFVHVDTDGQVDLARIAVCAAGGSKAEDRVVGESFQAVEHRCTPGHKNGCSIRQRR